MNVIDGQFLLKIFVAAIATVEIEEFIKNFLNTKKTYVYALLMIPLSIGSYFSVEVLPMWVIGGLLTIGCVQISYQTIVQGFKAIIENLARKIGSEGVKNV
jgi:hypothetical protein